MGSCVGSQKVVKVPIKTPPPNKFRSVRSGVQDQGLNKKDQNKYPFCFQEENSSDFCMLRKKPISVNSGQQSVINGLRKMPRAKPNFLNFGQQGSLRIKGKEKQEQRQLCQNPHQFPYSAICVLHTTFQNEQQGFATGFLIKENVVLTAAHIVFNRSDQCYAKEVYMYIQFNESSFKKFIAICAYAPNQFTKELHGHKIRQYDFAILIFDKCEKLGEKYGMIPLSSQNIQQKTRVEIYGYPNDLITVQYNADALKYANNESSKHPQQMYLFGCENQIVMLEERLIHYIVDTGPGQSGSAILRKKQKQNEYDYEAIGIHTRGGTVKHNSGVRITTLVIQRINKWIQSFQSEQDSQEKFMQLSLRNFLVTLDTSTYAWSGKSQYKYQQNQKSVICIHQDDSSWLCSKEDLPVYGEFVFTVKLKKLSKHVWEGQERSFIDIGIMDSQYKQKPLKDARSHSLFLSLPYQTIFKPNEKFTNDQVEKCSCSTMIDCLPALIQIHVNRKTNSIAWYYNLKQQAKSDMPKLWKKARKKLCAIVRLYCKDDSVSFL